MPALKHGAALRRANAAPPLGARACASHEATPRDPCATARLRNHHRRAARQGRADHAQPAAGAQRARIATHRARAERRRSTPSRRDDGDRRHRHHRLGQGLRRRRRHQGDAPARPIRASTQDDFIADWDGIAGAAQADHRGGGGLRARRRLRAGDDVRLHHRRRHGQVRPARDQARRHARHRRHAAPGARRSARPRRWRCASPAA